MVGVLGQEGGKSGTLYIVSSFRKPAKTNFWGGGLGSVRILRSIVQHWDSLQLSFCLSLSNAYAVQLYTSQPNP